MGLMMNGLWLEIKVFRGYEQADTHVFLVGIMTWVDSRDVKIS